MNWKQHPVIVILLLAALAQTTGCVPATATSDDVVPAAVTPGSDVQGAVVLTFTGLVENDLSLSMADLQAVDVVELTIEHPKEGKATYSGIMLGTLLDRAAPADDAILTFTAVDAYAVDVPVGDARACAHCMVAFDDGSLRLVMPDMGSSYWVKDVVSIEAK